MYKRPKFENNRKFERDYVQGETIEQKVQRITQQKEPITDGAPIIYTERKDGVLPQYDVRADRFEIALDATDKITRSKVAERENRLKIVKDEPSNGTDVN